MGMYVNLNLESYPEMVHGLLEQNPERNTWIEKMTEPFEHFGMTAGESESLITLKTNKPSENSLYTILKVAEPPK